MPPPATDRRPWTSWSGRWGRLARAAGLAPDDPVLLALSGGADSVLLLHLLGASEDRPPVVACHVNHHLRGAESDEDERFCRRLSASLGIPFRARSAPVDAAAPNLEERARDARWSVLVDVAGEEGLTTIVTGHHADDALETLLLRWLRGTALGGLGGLSATGERRVRGGPRLRVVRPLLSMRREEVRCLLADCGLEWREDSSNRDLRFQRNRIRQELLPWLNANLGPGVEDNLRAFAAAVESLEEHFAHATAHLTWSRPPWAAAAGVEGGGRIARAELARLPGALKRRALWRLVLEGTGRAPGRALLDKITADLEAGRCARHSLPGGFALQLRAAALHLIPPRPLSRPWADRRARIQPELPFPEPSAPPGTALSLPGEVALPDGRRLSASIVRTRRGAPVPTDPCTVELDAAGLPGSLWVRWGRPGDRIHPLGAPGSRRLCRFLAEAGVPREERDRVPLVFAGSELVWAAGVRPCEGRRVRASTETRVRLELRRPARPA